MHKKSWLLIILIICNFVSFSQVDSIQIYLKQYNSTNKKNLKMQLAYKIANLYEKTNTDSAIYFYKNVCDLSKKLNEKKFLYNSYVRISNLYKENHNIYQTLHFTKEALNIENEIYDYNKKLNLYINLVESYLYYELYDSAAFYTYFVIKIPDSELSSIDLFYKNYTIASVYLALNLSKLAVFYIDNANKYNRKLKDSLITSKFYYILAKYVLNEKNYQFSEVYFKKALQICPTKEYHQLFNISFELAKTYNSNKQYQLAKYYYAEIISSFNAHRFKDTLSIIRLNLEIANLLAKKEPKVSFGYFIIINKYVEKYQFNLLPLSIKIDFYKYLIFKEIQNNNYPIAIEYTKRKEYLQDSLNSIIQKAIANNFLYRFDLENKTVLLDSLSKTQELTNKIIQKQKERNRFQNYAIILLILIVLISFSFIFWTTISTKKIKQLNRELSLSNLKIQRAQKRLENIIGFLPEIFVEFDADGKIIRVNNNFNDISVFSFETENNSIYFWQLFAENHYQQIIKILKDLTDTNKNQIFEATLIGKEQKNVSTIVSLTHDKTKNRGEFYAIIIDITEKQRIEQELRFFQTVIQQTNNSVVITNKNAEIVFVNPAFENATGYKFLEVKNQNPRIFQSGLTPQIVYQEMWNILKNGGVWKGVLINKTKKGKIFHEKTIITPLVNKNTEITHFVAIKEDITEELRKSEVLKKLFSSVENSPVSVILLDTNRDITYVNPAFESITGYLKDDVLGKKSSFLNYASYTDDFYQNIWNEIENHYYWIGRYINVKKDKSLYWVQSTVIAVKNEDDLLIGYVLNEQDITQQIITQQQLENTLQQLNEKNAEIEASLVYSKRIQNSLIPTEKEFNNILNSFVIFLPKDIVSGDFYWIYKKDLLTFVILGDCTGHGVPGAFMSIIGLTVLEDAIVVNELETPSTILKYLGIRIRSFFTKNLASETIFDDIEISLAVINEGNNIMLFSSSRSRMYVVRTQSDVPLSNSNIDAINISYDRKMYVIKGDRFFLISDSISSNFTEYIIEALPTDTFYLSTDGYYDQFGGLDNKKMNRIVFENLLFDNSHLELEEQKELLLFNLVNWKGIFPQNDDISLIGFKIT